MSNTRKAVRWSERVRELESEASPTRVREARESWIATLKPGAFELAAAVLEEVSDDNYVFDYDEVTQADRDGWQV